jgi:hypothetical protein
MVKADDKPKTTSALLPWRTPTLTPLPANQSLSSTFAIEGELKIDELLNLRLDPTRSHRHGGMHATLVNVRGELEWTGAREWTLAALKVLRHQGELAPDITGGDLVKRVRNRLNQDPRFKNPKYRGPRGKRKRISYRLDRETIFEAARTLGIAWRSTRGRPPRS